MKLAKILLTFAVSFLSLGAYAQYDLVALPNRKSNPGIPGGPDGKSFAAIIETGGNKASLTKSTLDFLKKYEIVDAGYNIDAKIDEISEDMSMFTIPVVLRVGYHIGGLKIAPVSEQPIKVIADMRFEFYDNGNMMVVFDNLREETFVHQFTTSKSLYKEFDKNREKMDIGADLTSEWNTQYVAPLMTDTAIGKALIFMNVGGEGVKDFYKQTDAFFNDLNTRFRYLDEIAEKSKFFAWMTDKEAVDYMNDLIEKGDAYSTISSYPDKIIQEFESGRMLSLNKKTFQKSVLPIITRTLAAMYYVYGGKFIGIAEDGDQTWELVGDKLLPVDKKLRKSLEKKGQDFFTYAYED